MHQLRFAAVAVLLLCCFAGRVEAQDSGRQDPAAERTTPTEQGKAGTGFVEVRLGVYDNGDSGDGNPFLDESLTVIEPAVIYDYNVTDKLGVWGKFSFDLVSSASIDRLSKFPDQSGASGDYYFGLDVGTRYEVSDTEQVGVFLSGSAEYDYTSIGLGGHYTVDLDDHNTTLKTTANAFFDQLDIIRFDGTQNSTDDRTTLSGGLTWYQVIDPLTHSELGVSLTHQSGFLETPYNAVVVEDATMAPNPNLANMARGFEITEELPSDRFRTSVFGRLRRSLSEDTAVELGGRVYSDTWGINSFTIEPRVYQWLVRDILRGRLSYRYYSQGAADDYAERFTTSPTLRTQDADLADFDSHTVGLRFDWYSKSDWVIDFGVDYQMRSDGLDEVFASVGFRWDF